MTTALAEHLRRVNSTGFDVEDLESPRRNILVFHGVGGIGKSTLPRKVEASLAHSDHRPAQWDSPSLDQGQVLPVRIDLARSAGMDFERVILTIRLALAALGRPIPAFDLALRRYWGHRPPPAARNIARRTSFPTDMIERQTSCVPGVGTPRIKNSVRSRVRRHQASILNGEGAEISENFAVKADLI
ncbi:hypothetical protein [Streptomyces chengmaiensis]|uniref:hypothetical protein n=1 Tax=Streptomyces chengmaiensis TaxID=3040919 RepID=UPI0029625C29|nr:hypothetical protein [Streptomyces chengmaiensis]